MRRIQVSSIHLGDYPWLFYITRTDGNSYNDLLGISSDHVVEEWNSYFAKCSQTPYGYQAKFLFLSPPNKEAVFPEKMNWLFRDRVAFAHGTYARIYQLLANQYPQNYVSVLATLAAGKLRGPTYFTDDTHWNFWGAYLAHVEILKRVNRLLGTQFPILAATTLVAQGEGGKDILKMFNGADKFIGYELKSDKNLVLANFAPCCQLPIATQPYYAAFENPRGQKIMWFLGDSFREQLKPYLTQYFKITVFIDYKADRKRLMEEAFKNYGPPDLIIQEVLERNLSMPIPAADCD